MRNFLLLFICFLISPFALASSKVEQKDPVLFIEYMLDNKNVYERQPATCVVTLFSSTPDIGSVNIINNAKLKKGNFSSLQQVQHPGNPYEKDINGKHFYCFPIEAFVFAMADKGAYEFSGAEYKVGVSYPTIVNDPFWGPMRTFKTKEFIVNSKKLCFKVRSLPIPPDSMSFSGSVGEFSLETVVPPGDIFVNEEATAIIILRGSGKIAESTLPEYRKAFQSGLKLKSVSESRSELLENGRLVNELRLECTFIPSDTNNVEIGEVYFDYFDPSKGKYLKAVSKPVKIKVKSSVSKRESLAI